MSSLPFFHYNAFSSVHKKINEDDFNSTYEYMKTFNPYDLSVNYKNFNKHITGCQIIAIWDPIELPSKSVFR